MASGPIANPFATRHTRPAALAWLPQPDSPQQLLDRLDRLGGRGVICGPHGSGKSTLLRHLAAAATERGWQPRVISLGSVADLGRAVAAVMAAAEPDHWLGIDSWEKLGVLGRPLAWLANCPWKNPSMAFFHLRNARKRRGFSGLQVAASCGGRLFPQSAIRRRGRIVVTMHRQPGPGGWPVLLEPRPTADTFRRLVIRLLDQAAITPAIAARFDPILLDDVFRRHQGNLREAFFDLYDRFEQFARD